MSEEIIVKMYSAAVALTEWTFKKYRSASREKDYIPMLNACVTILSTAASRGEIQCIVWPMWWPAPADTVLDDEGNLQQPLGVRVAELHRWLATFDESAASFTASEWWQWIYPGEAEQGEQMTDGARIVGCFRNIEHTKRGAWYKESAKRFISKALDAGTPARKQKIIEYIMGLPEAKGSSPATWAKHVTDKTIGQVEEERKIRKT
ncbi:hypothetical protein [Candidatus Igneacidithiobacillus taiwanensis]|uniref:hypothetical protein n=1 Tax=Candidatus Igneacidithiobacillus taiwanensis TaxID=1945924 RepID=UPI002898BB8E|nr:hypothetical protein [Candidatus Igneacidithiobacillus taiwanensis]